MKRVLHLLSVPLLLSTVLLSTTHAEPDRVYLTKNPVVQAKSLKHDEDETSVPSPKNAVLPGSGRESGSGSMVKSLRRNLLYVSSIEIRGNYRLSKARVLQIAGLEQTPGVWQVNAQQIRAKLLAFPWIEEATVRTNPYPASLRIDIKEAEPWLIAEYERHSWLVSRKGVLLQPLDTLDNPDIILETTELSRIDGLQPIPGAESFLASANARFVHAVKMIKLVETAGEFPFPIERYTLLTGGGLKISAPPTSDAANGKGTYPQVLFAADTVDEAVMRVKRLQHVLEDLTRRGERARRIDLRFSNQVIVE